MRGRVGRRFEETGALKSKSNGGKKSKKSNKSNGGKKSKSKGDEKCGSERKNGGENDGGDAGEEPGAV